MSISPNIEKKMSKPSFKVAIRGVESPKISIIVVLGGVLNK